MMGSCGRSGRIRASGRTFGHDNAPFPPTSPNSPRKRLSSPYRRANSVRMGLTGPVGQELAGAGGHLGGPPAGDQRSGPSLTPQVPQFAVERAGAFGGKQELGSLDFDAANGAGDGGRQPPGPVDREELIRGAPDDQGRIEKA